MTNENVGACGEGRVYIHRTVRRVGGNSLQVLHVRFEGSDIVRGVDEISQ